MTADTETHRVRLLANGMARTIAANEFTTKYLRKVSVRYGFQVDVDVTDLLKENRALLKRHGLPEAELRPALIDRFRRAGYDLSFYTVERIIRRNLDMVRVRVMDPLPDDLEHLAVEPDEMNAPQAAEFARDYKQNRVKAVADSCERTLNESGEDSMELNMTDCFWPLRIGRRAVMDHDNSTLLDDVTAELQSRGYDVWHYGVRDKMIPQRTPVLSIGRKVQRAS